MRNGWINIEDKHLHMSTLVKMLSLTGLIALAQIAVPFPDGYLQWTHVKSGILKKGQPGFDHFGGIHHIYANTPAMEGYRTGHFPDGSWLVFDVFEAIGKDSVFTEGRRRIVDVMIKDSAQYAATGGWGFEEFQGDSRTERNLNGNVTECYNCHAYRKTHDFVFSVLPPSPSRP